MFKSPFVAQSSSLYPIDLTACLFHSVLHPDSEIRVFITDSFSYPDSPTRPFVARASLPLSEWEFTGANTWQQRHLPLSASSGVQINALLAACGDSFIRTAPVLELAVQRNVDLLATGYWAEKPPIGEFQQPWALTSARLLATVFRQCAVQHVTIEPFGARRDGRLPSNEAVEALRDLAAQLEPGIRYRFLAGGAVERYVSSEWRAFEHLESGSGALRLGDGIAAPFFDETFDDPAARWRFRGSAELLLLRQSGILVDLPWYSLGHEFLATSERADGAEIISPLHFADARRSAGAHRLLPTGYTLIEYEHPAVRTYVEAALGCRIRKSEDLGDVRRFIGSPPAGSHRLTKAQRSTRAYRNALEQDWRRRLLSTPEAAAEIHNIDDRPHALRLGERLTLMHAVITLLKEHINGHLDLRECSELWIALTQAGIVGLDGKLSVHLLLSLLSLDRRACEANLRHHGRQLAPPNSELDRGLAERTFLSRLRDEYQLLADEHYGWLAFMLAGPLKAHILALFLLIGPGEIRGVVTKVISARLRPTLPFALSPWERVPS